MHRLKYSILTADVRAWRNPQATYQTSGQIGNNIAIQVRQDQHIVLLGFLYKLHAHIVYNTIFKLNIRVFFAYYMSSSEEQSIRTFHYVGFVNRCNLTASISPGIVKRELDNPARCHHRNIFDTDRGIIIEAGPGGGSRMLDKFFLFRSPFFLLPPPV